jgi:hypothetical protein
MGRIRLFAAILQAPETSSKLVIRLCTAEVRGSIPLGSTLEICGFAGKTRRKGEHPGCYPGPYAATVQQRGGEYAKVIVSGFYDLWSGGIPEIRSDLRNRLGIHG